MAIFEAWFDECDDSVCLTPLSEVDRLRRLGAWLQKPVFLHRIRAESLEAAVKIHRDMMDWDNFPFQTDPIEACPVCGVSYFPKRSTACPNCQDAP